MQYAEQLLNSKRKPAHNQRILEEFYVRAHYAAKRRTKRSMSIADLKTSAGRRRTTALN
jgi:hypothetical protein